MGDDKYTLTNKDRTLAGGMAAVGGKTVDDELARTRRADSAASPDSPRRPGYAINPNSFRAGADGTGGGKFRESSIRQSAGNALTSLRAQRVEAEGTGIFAGRKINALASGSLLERWDAEGNFTPTSLVKWGAAKKEGSGGAFGELNTIALAPEPLNPQALKEETTLSGKYSAPYAGSPDTDPFDTSNSQTSLSTARNFGAGNRILIDAYTAAAAQRAAGLYDPSGREG